MLQLLREESARHCQTKIDAVSFLMFRPASRALVRRGCDLYFNMRSAWISYKHPATLTNTISVMIQNLQLIH